ncbi:MAG: bifunctional demethylmenaquinone methyltransferase/2-methoxy-6-polyprenyl-1,4-benzoquinol methylase UbiE [Bacteroidaceae bacterium]|nr:bifunctional demethylmenaquinone methyltransferase/2-methoxy-6-polyprenyl-1,4-benzoquinol methylase UbiE [Bacteroidaceae bacterium]
MINDVTPYHSNESKRKQVEAMFDNIASTYDSLNHTMSLGIDRKWRNCVVNYLKDIGSWPMRVLDVATGTGDLALLAAIELGSDEVVGVDISDKMMKIGEEKAKALNLSQIVRFVKEDCSSMTFSDKSFEAVISAFALRNFENIPQCLSEMRRVLQPNGDIVVIDLCAPRKFPMRQVFYVYKKIIMPCLGAKIAKDKLAFQYLPETMSEVPQGEDMAELFRAAGFSDVKYKYLNFGMCCMYTAKR